MVSKKDLKLYEFETIRQYFDYIIKTGVNGQLKQVKNLINELSLKQKVMVLHYIDVNYICDKSEVRFVIREIQQSFANNA